MSIGVAAYTRLVGGGEGKFLDDLTNSVVGQWPQRQAIEKITKIAVWSGDIIDSIRITYKVKNETNGEETVVHGGDGGSQKLIYELQPKENLLAIYGEHLKDKSLYGFKNLVGVSFVFVDTSGDEPKVTVKTWKGSFFFDHEHIPFELAWPLTAASSYTYQPQGRSKSYLQGISFSQVFGQAN